MEWFNNTIELTNLQITLWVLIQGGVFWYAGRFVKTLDTISFVLMRVYWAMSTLYVPRDVAILVLKKASSTAKGPLTEKEINRLYDENEVKIKSLADGLPPAPVPPQSYIIKEGDDLPS